MAANTSPIFTLTPNIGFSTIVAANANTALDGTGTTSTLFTAGANGSFAQILYVKSNTTTATTNGATLRLFVNNGSSSGTAANNSFFREYTLTTVTASNSSATINFEFPLNLQLPADYVLLGTIAVMASSTGFAFTVVGGNY